MRNALTVDLEDWYQGLTSTARRPELWPTYESRVEANTRRLLDELARAGVTATFFVLGYVADHHPQLVRQVADAGHEIALHGYWHRKVSGLTPAEFREDTLRAKRAVETAAGKRVVGYRAPMFSINRTSLWALRELADMGFAYDSSVFPTRNMLYGYPEAPRFPYRPLDDDAFIEYPLSTARLLGINWAIAGGFYLRALPYALLARGVRHVNREGHPAIIYLHPWDLDPGQPRPGPTVRERITHYYNLGSTATKLVTLLRDFRFGRLGDLTEGIAAAAAGGGIRACR